MARVKLLQDFATLRGTRSAGSLYICSEAEAGRLIAAGFATMVIDEPDSGPESTMVEAPEHAVRQPARARRGAQRQGGML